MNKKLLSLMLASGLVLGVSQVFSASVNITMGDNANTSWGFNGGPTGQGLEDNETEKANGISTIRDQAWDMEAFVVNGTKLYIIGGYNMSAGKDGLTPGDLFIRVAPDNIGPGWSPNTATSGLITNGGLGYTHVVDLTQVSGAGVTSGPASVYGLNLSSKFDSVDYDQLNSNPWRYSNTANALTPPSATATVTYHVAKDNAYIQTLTGLNLGLKDNSASLTGLTHNILVVDLGFLTGVTDQVFFSYTMECGNDSLKGQWSGGFYRTPDGAASILLIGLGMSAMAFFGLNRRR